MKFAILLLALTAAAFAGEPPPVAVPEIDATTATAAITLLSGSLLVLRSRRVKK